MSFSNSLRRVVWIGLVCVLLLLEHQVPGGTADDPGLSIWIPQYGHGTAAGNLIFSTDVLVNNLSESTSEFTIETYDPVGNPASLLADESEQVPTAAQSLTRSLGDKQIVRIRSISPEGPLALGYARIRTTSAISVEVIFNLFDSRSGELLTATNIRPGILNTAGTAFTANETRRGALNESDLGASRPVRSGLALLNPPGNDDDADVLLTVRDESGQLLGSEVVPLPVGERISRFVDQLLPDLEEFTGSIDFESRLPGTEETGPLLAILPLRQERLILTTQLVFPPRIQAPAGNTTRRFYIPQFAHGVSIANNLLLTTETLVLNLDTTEASFRLEAYDAEGAPFNGLQSPGGQAVNSLNTEVAFQGTARILSAGSSDSISQGWALLSSEQFVVVEVVFNLFNATTGELLTATNVPIFPLLTATSFFAFEEGQLAPLETPAGAGARARSGVALLNPLEVVGDSFLNGDPASVELTVFNDAGEQIGEATINLEAGERVAMFVDQLIEARNFAGSIELRSNNPLLATSGTPISIMPLRQEGIILTTQALFPPRVLR